MELMRSCQHAYCSGLITNQAGSAHTSRIHSNAAFILREEEEEENEIKASWHEGKEAATAGHHGHLHRASPVKAPSVQVNPAFTFYQIKDKTSQL